MKTVNNNRLGVKERAEFESSVYQTSYDEDLGDEEIDEDEDYEVDEDVAFEEDSALFEKLDAKFVTKRRPMLDDPVAVTSKSAVEKTKQLKKPNNDNDHHSVMMNTTVSSCGTSSSASGSFNSGGTSLSSSRIGDYLCKCDLCRQWIYSRADKVRLGEYVTHRDCVKCFVCDNALHDYKIYPQINSQMNGKIYGLKIV